MAEKKIIDLQINSNLNQTAKDASGLNTELNQTSKSVGGVGDSVSTLNPALGKAISGAQGLNKTFLTLLANPIVAVIAGIVAAATLLFKAFVSTKAGGEQLDRVIAGISAVIDVLRDRVLKVGEAIVKFFSGDFKGAIATGREAVSGFGAEVEKEFRQAAEATKFLQEVADATRELGVSRAKLNRDLARSKEILTDDTASFRDKKKAIDEVRVAEEKQTKAELENAEKKLKAIKIANKLSDTSKEDLQKQADAESALFQLQEQSAQNIRNLNRQERTIEAQERARVNAIVKAEQEKKIEDLKFSANRIKEISDFNDLNQKLEEERKKQSLDNEKDLFDKRLKQITNHVQAVQQTYKDDAKEQAEIDRILLETKTKNMEAGMALGFAALAVLGQQSKAGKIIAAGMAAIDTFSAINRNLKAFSAVPIPGYAIAQAIATGVFGLVNVKRILSTQLPGGSGGGAAPSLSSAGGGASQQSTAPQFNVVGANGISQVAQSLAGNRQPIKAFVVGKDVSTQQALDRNIVKFASLG
jgi:hypothetical protein